MFVDPSQEIQEGIATYREWTVEEGRQMTARLTTGMLLVILLSAALRCLGSAGQAHQSDVRSHSWLYQLATIHYVQKHG